MPFLVPWSHWQLKASLTRHRLSVQQRHVVLDLLTLKCLPLFRLGPKRFFLLETFGQLRLGQP